MRATALLVTVLVVLAAPLGSAQDDPALVVARDIAARVASFPSFRAEHALGAWTERPEAVWSVRPETDCHRALEGLGVSFEPFQPASPLPIPAPVRLRGAVSGVTFRKLRPRRPVIVACELAARLPAIASVLARHEVTEVRVLSAWRRAPRESFHTMGLALDLCSFVRSDGSVLDVARDYHPESDGPSCEGAAPDEERAAALRAIACDLAASGVVSTVLTPAYSEGHRDHLHIDIRPDDPRTFVR
jgi:hypothetical protein